MTQSAISVLTAPAPRTAIVTGAAQGLGAAMARALHADGCRVVLADRNVALAESVAASLDASGATAQGVALDVRSREQFTRMFDAVLGRFGRVDVLINNAGVTTVRPFTEISETEWEEVLAINLRSAFFGCQIAAPHMKSNGWGRIINITSLAGQIGSRLAGAHYSVSKAGLICLTKVVAKEYAAHGVTANAISPAVVRAPVMASLPADGLRRLIDSVPVGRMGEAEEVGALAAFLASGAAGYITGATIDINGGQNMR